MHASMAYSCFFRLSAFRGDGPAPHRLARGILLCAQLFFSFLFLEFITVLVCFASAVGKSAFYCRRGGSDIRDGMDKCR